MATKYDQSSATRPVSIRSHTSAFQVHFKHTSSALEMSSVNPPTMPDSFLCRHEKLQCIQHSLNAVASTCKVMYDAYSFLRLVCIISWLARTRRSSDLEFTAPAPHERQFSAFFSEV